MLYRRGFRKLRGRIKGDYGSEVSLASGQYESQERKESRKEDCLEGDFGQEMQDGLAVLVRAGQKEFGGKQKDGVGGGGDRYAKFLTLWRWG
jgi:hypothetical protein